MASSSIKNQENYIVANNVPHASDLANQYMELNNKYTQYVYISKILSISLISDYSVIDDAYIEKYRKALFATPNPFKNKESNNKI